MFPLGIIGLIVGCAICTGCVGCLLLQIRKRSPDGSFQGFLDSFRSPQNKQLHQVHNNQIEAIELDFPEPDAPPMERDQSVSRRSFSDNNSGQAQASVVSIDIKDSKSNNGKAKTRKHSKELHDPHLPPPYSERDDDENAELATGADEEGRRVLKAPSLSQKKVLIDDTKPKPSNFSESINMENSTINTEHGNVSDDASSEGVRFANDKPKVKRTFGEDISGESDMVGPMSIEEGEEDLDQFLSDSSDSTSYAVWIEVRSTR